MNDFWERRRGDFGKTLLLIVLLISSPDLHEVRTQCLCGGIPPGFALLAQEQRLLAAEGPREAVAEGEERLRRDLQKAPYVSERLRGY